MNGADRIKACAAGGSTSGRRARRWRLCVVALGLIVATALHASIAVATAPAKAAGKFQIKHLPDPYHAKRLYVHAGMVGTLRATAALRSLIFAAEKQDPVAEYWLGRYYWAHAKRNNRYGRWALRWLNDSAEKKCRRAAAALYTIYSKTVGNQHLSQKYLDRAAALGWPPAEYTLGLRLLTGHATPADIVPGLKLLRGAATARYFRALGPLYKISISANMPYRQEARRAIVDAAKAGWVKADGFAASALARAPHPNYAEAWRFAEIGAQRRDALSDAVLGSLYAAGDGVKKNLNRAFQYYLAAGKLGNRSGAASAGYMMLNGIGTPPSFKRGMKYLTAAYRSGSGRAPYTLGAYFARKGNLPEAEKWWNRTIKTGISPWAQKAEYRLRLYRATASKGAAASPRALFELNRGAAREGDVRAEYETGLLYSEGKGVHPNLGKAINWLKKALQSHYFPAMAALGNISVSTGVSQTDRREARRAIVDAAKAGWVRADGEAALAFLRAPHPDYAEALQWAKLGELRGDAFSDAVLSNLYAAGDGVKKDPKRAFQFALAAAKLGYRPAARSAGYMMLYGIGTPPSFKRGMKYLMLAYHGGSGSAPYTLGLYFAGKGNLPEAKKWWNRTIKTGISPYAQDAMVKLGVLLIQNIKRPKDQAAGFALFHRAAVAGLATAEYATGVLYLEGTGTAKNRAKAIAWLEKAAATKGIIGIRAAKLLSTLHSKAPASEH